MALQELPVRGADPDGVEMRIIDFVLGRGYYQRCRHRSHRWHLKCWRYASYDYQCPKHNRSCWGRCP